MLLIICNHQIPLPRHDHKLKPRLNGRIIHNPLAQSLHNTNPKPPVPSPDTYIEEPAHANTVNNLPILNRIHPALTPQRIHLNQPILQPQHNARKDPPSCIWIEPKARRNGLFQLHAGEYLARGQVEYGHSADCGDAVQVGEVGE